MALPNLPGPYMVGKNVVLLGFTPATVANDGVTLTAAATTSLLGKFESIVINYSTRTENIKPANIGVDNNVIISDAFDVEITEIIPANGNSVLEAKYLTYDYFQVTFQAAAGPNGVGTAGGLKTLLGVRGSLTFGAAEGKNVAVFKMTTAGVNPAIT